MLSHITKGRRATAIQPDRVARGGEPPFDSVFVFGQYYGFGPSVRAGGVSTRTFQVLNARTSPKKYIAPQIPNSITPTEGEYHFSPRRWKDLYERKRPVASPFCNVTFPLILDFDLLDVMDIIFPMAKTLITAHMK
jgi:hypothetical protein